MSELARMANQLPTVADVSSLPQSVTQLAVQTGSSGHKGGAGVYSATTEALDQSTPGLAG